MSGRGRSCCPSWAGEHLLCGARDPAPGASRRAVWASGALERPRHRGARLGVPVDGGAQRRHGHQVGPERPRRGVGRSAAWHVVPAWCPLGAGCPLRRRNVRAQGLLRPACRSVGRNAAGTHRSCFTDGSFRILPGRVGSHCGIALFAPVRLEDWKTSTLTLCRDEATKKDRPVHEDRVPVVPRQVHHRR